MKRGNLMKFTVIAYKDVLSDWVLQKDGTFIVKHRKDGSLSNVVKCHRRWYFLGFKDFCFYGLKHYPRGGKKFLKMVPTLSFYPLFSNL